MYKVKKQNILNMLKFLINQELQNFHTKQIDNRYSIASEDFVAKDDMRKSLTSERIVHWNSLIKKSFDYIVDTPSKDVLQTRLKLFKQTPDCTDVMYEHIVDALKGYLEVSNLGNSEAFIELMNVKQDKGDLTFEWMSGSTHLEQLFNELKAYGLLGNESTLNHFKKALGGGLLSDIEPINFKGTNTLVVYLFDMMNKYRLIRYASKPNKVIETITGITSVAQTRDKYLNSKTGLPKGSQDVDNILQKV
jgi:uncharacterized protein YutD